MQLDVQSLKIPRTNGLIKIIKNIYYFNFVGGSVLRYMENTVCLFLYFSYKPVRYDGRNCFQSLKKYSGPYWTSVNHVSQTDVAGISSD